MTRVSDHVTEGTVVTDLRGPGAPEALRRLVDVLATEGAVAGGDALYEALMRREEIMTTGLGGGVAIPHAWAPDVKRVVVAVGRSPEGIAWNALDGRPVRLVFLLATPEEDPLLHLQILAGVARLARQEGLKERLLSLALPRDLVGEVAEAERMIGA